MYNRRIPRSTLAARKAHRRTHISGAPLRRLPRLFFFQRALHQRQNRARAAAGRGGLRATPRVFSARERGAGGGGGGIAADDITGDVRRPLAEGAEPARRGPPARASSSRRARARTVGREQKTTQAEPRRTTTTGRRPDDQPEQQRISLAALPPPPASVDFVQRLPILRPCARGRGSERNLKSRCHVALGDDPDSNGDVRQPVARKHELLQIVDRHTQARPSDPGRHQRGLSRLCDQQLLRGSDDHRKSLLPTDSHHLHDLEFPLSAQLSLLIYHRVHHFENHIRPHLPCICIRSSSCRFSDTPNKGYKRI